MNTTTCIRRPSATFTTCTCPDCVRRRRRLHKIVRAGMLPARRTDEAWAIVDARIAAGWSLAAIASAAGVPVHTIRGGVAGRRRDGQHEWSRVIAHRIINSQPWPERGVIPAVGAVRRLRALAAMGYTLQDVRDATGLPMMTLQSVRVGRVNTTHAETHKAIREAYARLEMTPGPSVRTRRAAVRDGWAPPLAWDDIDDPNEQPNYGGQAVTGPDATIVERILRGEPCHTTVEDRAELVPLLAAKGLSDSQVAELLRCTARTVHRTRVRHNIPSQWKASS